MNIVWYILAGLFVITVFLIVVAMRTKKPIEEKDLFSRPDDSEDCYDGVTLITTKKFHV